MLESNPDPKYNLSPKACLGILRRAEGKGKKLPELLEQTLKRQAGLSPNILNVDLKSDCETYSLEGNGSRPSHRGSGFSEGSMYTLNSVEHHSVCVVEKCLNPWDVQSKHIQPESGIAESLYSGECRGGGGESYVMQNIPCLAFDRAAYNQGKNAQYNFSIEEELAQTIVAKGPGGVMYKSVVRRLTPTECERLQGYPDGWTDLGEWEDSSGKVHKPADSCRYKALGNSIALPFWAELAKAVASKYPYSFTMGSLFDGIGGFPLVFERVGAKAIWASEIEEFPIAVTKRRFPDGE